MIYLFFFNELRDCIHAWMAALQSIAQQQGMAESGWWANLSHRAATQPFVGQFILDTPVFTDLEHHAQQRFPKNS
jgi:hypothetical protein